MTEQNVPMDTGDVKPRPRVKYLGTSKFGAECAVLEDGRRGYVMRSLQRAIGMTGGNRSIRFAGFLAEIAPNVLNVMEESGYPVDVTMPHGGTAKWAEAGILTEIASGVVEAALDGRLRADRAHLVKPSMPHGKTPSAPCALR